MSSSGDSGVFYPVHQLHPDPELPNPRHHHDLIVIFVHGFSNGTDAWKKTWIQRDDPAVCWPRNWLPKDEEEGGLGDNILVLSVSFDANPDGAHESVQEIGKNLVNDAKWKWNSQTIVLVGHSFGGLVIKSLMVEVDNAIKANTRNLIERKKQLRCKPFRENLTGIMFYAVPHIGADKKFETDCKHVLFSRNTKRSKSLMNDIESFNGQMVQRSKY